MKSGMTAGLVLALAASAAAQQETLEEKRDKKLKAEWLVNGGWLTDYDKARASAKESKKPIFGYFTRSYSF
jgi:hypothetical protein